MTRPRCIRYPFAPLRAVIDPRRERTNAQLAEMLDVHPRQLERYRREGVTDSAADHLAVRAGAHPASVWPEWCHALAVSA